MSKRKNSDAQVPADQQPKTVVDPKPEAGGASEVEAGVVGDSGPAVETIAQEQPAEPDAPALVHDEGQVTDAAGTEDLGGGDIPAGDEDAAGNAPEGAGSDAPAIDGDAGSAGADDDSGDIRPAVSDALNEETDHEDQDKTGELDDFIDTAGNSAGGDGILAADRGEPTGDDGTGSDLRDGSALGAGTGLRAGSGDRAAPGGEGDQRNDDALKGDPDVSESATDAAAGGASGTAGVQSADNGPDAGDDGADAIDAAGQGDDADGSADPAPGAGSGTAPADAAETTAGLTDDDDTERCLACGEILVEGDLVFDDFVNGGIGHAECAGTDPTHFHDAGGEPLKEGDPLPTPHPYEKPSTIDARMKAMDEPDRPDPTDMIVRVAEEMTFDLVNYLGEMFPLSDDEHALVRKIAGFSDAASGPTNGMAQLIRTIGVERATPPVLGQQLKIDGHLESGELSLAQALVVKVFATIVQELDQFEKDYLEANRPVPTPADPRPVPIDETTLEPVDGTMETWSQ